MPSTSTELPYPKTVVAPGALTIPVPTDWVSYVICAREKSPHGAPSAATSISSVNERMSSENCGTQVDGHGIGVMSPSAAPGS